MDFIGLGRMVLSYPDLPCDVPAKCNAASSAARFPIADSPRNGIGFPLDSFYKQREEAQRLQTLKKEAQ